MTLLEETRTVPLLKLSTLHTCQLKNKKSRVFLLREVKGQTVQHQDLRICLPYRSHFRLDKVALLNWEQPESNYKAK